MDKLDFREFLVGVALLLMGLGCLYVGYTIGLEEVACPESPALILNPHNCSYGKRLFAEGDTVFLQWRVCPLEREEG